MGKTKGKIVKAGVKGSLTVKDSDVVISYDQPLADELGIVAGAAVTLTLVKSGKEKMAVAVSPVNKGEITEIDYTRGAGVIVEKGSKASYRFYQNYLKETGFVVGDKVTYKLARLNSKLTAVCLDKAAAKRK